MKIYSVIVIGTVFLLSLPAHAQKKQQKESFPTYEQIMPKFSEMTDHGLPSKTQTYESPDGQVSTFNEVNANGTARFVRTEMVVIPNGNRDSTDKEKKKSGKSASQKTDNKLKLKE
ncbi:hypothetical protein [Dyadobacter diqingensis]|uniref:hypothetical protein n=1 Tax=Dyadobacter diqingensis TaxID=2938121 RepID=UPI0020C45826|nr:hypothetical protein [Dyadobacter diqingensis]